MNFLNRDILQEILKSLDSREIVVLLGSRQVGKTTLLKMAESSLPSTDWKSLFLDMDLETNFSYLKDLETLLNYIQLKGIDIKKERLLLFIDEFQRVPSATKILKNIYDHHENIKVLVSGSSSLEISNKLTESMAGRKKIFRIFPLSFKEYLHFNEENELHEIFNNIKEVNPVPDGILQRFNARLEEFIIYGGYPAAVLKRGVEQKIQYTEEIFNSYIKKDIRDFLKIEDIASYNRLVELLALNIGGLLNKNSLMKNSGISRRKMDKYLFLILETFVVEWVKPFFSNKQKEIVKNPKLFFEDTGIRNFIIRNFNPLGLRQDAGMLLENFVYNELRKSRTPLLTFNFWRTKMQSEVDFVLTIGEQTIPIEVKYGDYSQHRIPPGMKAFMNQYNSKTGVVINKSSFSIANIDGRKIFLIPAFLAGKTVEMIVERNR